MGQRFYDIQGVAGAAQPCPNIGADAPHSAAEALSYGVGPTAAVVRNCNYGGDCNVVVVVVGDCGGSGSDGGDADCRH